MADSMKQNSLFRYFKNKECETQRKRKDASDVERGSGDSQVSTSKKTRTEPEAETQQSSRVRKFQTQWQSVRPWLKYSEDTKSMTCSYCIDYNTGGGREERSALATKEGCTTFRLETLKKHEESATHKLAVEKNLVRSQRPEQRPMESCILRMEKDNFEKISKLFKTAYYIAQAERPFSDLCGLVNLMESMSVEFGLTYRNDKQAAQFVHFIAEAYKADLSKLVKSSDLFSLLIDSSTDVSVIDEEIMYLRLLENGRPVTKYFSLQALERSNAEGILKAVDKAFNEELNLEHNQWCQKTVGFGADGASVMMGQRGGVSALIKRDVPYLVSIHCAAHRLELGIKDTIKQVAYLATVEELLLGLYKFYHNSPLNWTNLKESGVAAGIKVLKPCNVYGTRWISHHERGLTAVYRDWPCLVTHLEQVAIDGQSKDAKAKASGFVKKLLQFRCAYFFHFLMDLYKILARMSLEFQKNDTSVENVTRKLEATLEALRSLQTTPGPVERKFMEQVGDGTLYKGKELSNRPGGLKQAQIDKRAVLQSCLTHIQRHFQSFESDDILKAMRIFDFRDWPLHRDQLLLYGNDKLQVLTNHYEDLLNRMECDIPSVTLEWQEIKIHVARRVSIDPALSYLDLWQRIILEDQDEFKNIVKFIKIVLLIPIHTAECERGFSLMARVKTDWRANLSTPRLSDLMRIKLCGPGLDKIADFDPMPGVLLWWNAGTRARRPNVQPHGPRQRQMNAIVHEVEDSDDEDEDDE